MNAFYLFFFILLISCKKQPHFLSMQSHSYTLTTESQLTDSVYSKQIEDFYASGTEGFFKGKADVSIYYKFFVNDSSQHVIVISAGRTEAAVKYKELIFDLFQNGYSVFILDHRGQGQSGRMTPDPDMGYVESFQYYIDDLHRFVTDFVKPRNFDKTFLVAHSMGGAIGLTYLQQFPNDFTATAFSSPMWGLNPPICFLTKILTGDTPEYAIGQSGYDDDKSKFKGNVLMGSEIRYHRMIDTFAQVPEARLGGVSYQWLYESCKQFEVIFDHIDQIQIPFIVFTAENEQVVNPDAHLKLVEVAKKQGKFVELYHIKGAQHELFFERDEARILTLSTMLDFFKKNE